MRTLRARHTTPYHYADAVSVCHNEVRLTPREFGRQRTLDSQVTVRPEPDVTGWRKDYFGNEVITFSIHEPHEELVIVAESRVEVNAPAATELKDSPNWELVAKDLQEDLEACQFLFESPMVPTSPEFREYARECFPPAQPLLEGAWALCRKVHREFRYQPKSTSVDTPVTEVLVAKRGVCQDFSHVMIACLRSLGLAARYVSGYLESSPKFVGAEASHAWVSVYCPGSGWSDYDPTNDLIPQERHVTLAWGRDYSDVPPVKGVTLGARDHTITVGVGVVAEV